MLKSTPMKFQNINPMTTFSTFTNTLIVIKTFALDLDTITYNECSILPSIGFFIYPILPGQVASCIINQSFSKTVQKKPISMIHRMSPIG